MRTYKSKRDGMQKSKTKKKTKNSIRKFSELQLASNFVLDKQKRGERKKKEKTSVVILD